MSQEDVTHYLRRATEERERALSAGDPRVAKSYNDLAEKYDAVAAAYMKLDRS